MWLRGSAKQSCLVAGLAAMNLLLYRHDLLSPQHSITNFVMADPDQHLVASKITLAIKLTGILISCVHEHLWGLDSAPATPGALPNLLAALQAVGKSLSALRKFATDDVDLVASVLHRLAGPVDGCAAEMDRLRGKIVDGGLPGMVENGLVFRYIVQLEKHQGVFALALQVMQDHWYVGFKRGPK